MSAAQKRSYKNIYTQYCVPVSNSPVSFDKIFNNKNPITIEIGFGMGLATAIIAESNSCKNYLGIEIYKAGIGRLLWEIEKRELKNIRIIEHNAVDVLQLMIPDNSVSAFHIFFPDPWPKRKHHKRRLVKRPFTDLLAQKLEPGGYIYMVSDCKDYGIWALSELSLTNGLSNEYADFAPRQDWRPRTKFEAKALAKENCIWELLFKKK
jgi:tRNA (guanine-N7-)-methyltransferase